jgi:regulator of protease activity HflC (stomatin/prohibitin superfamily)
MTHILGDTFVRTLNDFLAVTPFIIIGLVIAAISYIAYRNRNSVAAIGGRAGSQIIGWTKKRLNSAALKKYLGAITSSNKATLVILTASAITVASLVILAAVSLAIVAWIIRIDLFSYSVIYAAVALAILLFVAKQLFRFLPWMWRGCFVTVPPVQKGIVLRFGQRTGEIMDEGLGVKWPFIETVELAALGLKRAELEIKFPSKGNKEWLVVEAVFTYHPDLTIGSNGRSVYVEVAEKDLRDTVADKISSKIAGLSQFYSSEYLLRSRPAIADYIRCWLRLKNMPHEHSMHAKDVLKYYADERVAVKTALDNERKQPDEHSEIEMCFGIDVEDFILSELDFTAETIAAREEQVHTEMKARALDVRFKKIRDLLALPGATFQEAVDEVDIALDPRIKRQIISVEGNASTVVVPANLFGGTKGGDGTDSSGDVAKGKKGGKR